MSVAAYIFETRLVVTISTAISRIFLVGAIVVAGGYFTASEAHAGPAPVDSGSGSSTIHIFRHCESKYIQWAALDQKGAKHFQMTIRPTWRAFWFGWDDAETMWDHYFECIGTRSWFNRLTSDQQASLRLQHRCHLAPGPAARKESGYTFDYESWHPNRGSLPNAIKHGCN